MFHTFRRMKFLMGGPSAKFYIWIPLSLRTEVVGYVQYFAMIHSYDNTMLVQWPKLKNNANTFVN